jgi:hypothetical protein
MVVNSTTGLGWTTGVWQPLNHAANRSSTHKPSVRELLAIERCSNNFGRLVLTQNLKVDDKIRLGPEDGLTVQYRRIDFFHQLF